ncbi:WD40 repeat domain-containing protein [Aspergillus undulatus]|uniref:WD40 repeat domain-containing protein n=1 Tax=Aspergillus undulatus TaxID=1810928 RepID=UPI003CCD7BE2
MPGQRERERAFQPSSASASHISSSSFSPPDLQPPSQSPSQSDDRALPVADSSSCHYLGFPPQPESLSFDESSQFAHYQDMAVEDDEHLVGSSAAGLQEQPVLYGFGSVSAPLQNAYSDEALSAFMSVPRYPEATNSNTRISVSEIVNAVIEPGDYFRRQYTASQENAGSHISPTELYESDSEMTDALSEAGGVSLDEWDMDEMAQFASHVTQDIDTQNSFNSASATTEEGTAMNPDMESEHNTSRHAQISFSTQEDDGDTRKFYLESGDRDDDSDTDSDSIYDDRSHTSDVDLDDFYRPPGYTYSQVTGVDHPSSHEDHTNFFSEADDVNGDPAADPHFADSVVHGTTQERNFDIGQFISQWIHQFTAASIQMPSLAPPVFPQTHISNILRSTPPAKISRPSGYTGNFYDLQQIPWWEKLRVKRSEARQLRDQWYTSYHNLQLHPQMRPRVRLPEEEFYFRGKSMYTGHKATIQHFQLRNLMSVPAYNTVHFAHESKLYSWVPAYYDLQCLIDLSMPSTESGFQGPVKISTMKSAVGVSIAGGFFGEYAVRAMGTEDKGVEGYVTKDPNGITNHIDIISSRTNRSPIGVFASNDRHVRTLDCETNTFVSDHQLTHAVNCTSTSPDGRLRVISGDSPDAWVVEADTGRPVHPLRGHRDFGFACAWSPDMMQIATSNQDKTAIIWDVRNWRALEIIDSDVAGYRSLRFSPVGGGPRTLMLCEPADRMVIVNAQTYESRQVHDFFGEVGGADFSPDGGTIWLANTDEHFGGFMEYDRAQWGQQYGLEESPNEWVKESDLDDDERCILSERERQSRYLWNMTDEEHDELLLY